MLPNLPENHLLRLLPEAVANEDTRSILRALLSGYQERVSDFRFAARQLTFLYDPDLAPPKLATVFLHEEVFTVDTGAVAYAQPLADLVLRIEEVTLDGVTLTHVESFTTANEFSTAVRDGVTVLLFGNGTTGALATTGAVITARYSTAKAHTLTVTFQDEDGLTQKRVLDILEDTPQDYAECLAWIATQMAIPLENVQGFVVGLDRIREVTGNVLPDLMATLGGVLYRNPLLAPEEVIDDQRRQVRHWFPRLRLKGTPASFGMLGRILGFSAARMVPLWGRACCRLPDEPGNPVNDPDFSASPQIAPESELYDAAALQDGVFYTYESGVLSVDPEDAAYAPYAVNGLNPFVRLVEDGTAFTLPPTGYFFLANGASEVKASVQLAPGLRAEALIPGEALNGLRLELTPGGTLRIQGRLSKRKYRTSLFDAVLLLDADRLAAEGLVPVRDNPHAADLSADCPSGKPFAGGWNGSGVRPAPPGTQQLDDTLLTQLSANAARALEEVRPATRFPRRVTIGLSYEDDVRYAPQASLLLLSTGTGTYSGTLPRPADTRTGVKRFGSFVRNGTSAFAGYQLHADEIAPYTIRAFTVRPGQPREVQRTDRVLDRFYLNSATVAGVIDLTPDTLEYDLVVTSGPTSELTGISSTVAYTPSGVPVYRLWGRATTEDAGGGLVKLTINLYGDPDRTLLAATGNNTGGISGAIPAVTVTATGFSATFTSTQIAAVATVDFIFQRTDALSVYAEVFPTSSETIQEEPEYARQTLHSASAYNGSLGYLLPIAGSSAPQVDWVKWGTWGEEAYLQVETLSGNGTVRAYRQPYDPLPVAMTVQAGAAFHALNVSTGSSGSFTVQLSAVRQNASGLTRAHVFLQRAGSDYGLAWQDRPEDELRTNDREYPEDQPLAVGEDGEDLVDQEFDTILIL